MQKGIALLDREDGDRHWVAFSGVAGIWGDRAGHYYRVGTAEELTTTLRDAGYKYGEGTTYDSAAVLRVNVASVNIAR